MNVKSISRHKLIKLTDGVKNKIYTVKKINLPVKILKHLEALGMTPGAEIIVLNKKSSALIAGFRGTRFALGRQIAENIEITEIIKGGV